MHRHSNKSRRWVAARYFTWLPGLLGGDNWVFRGEIAGRSGDPSRVLLSSASRTRIERHVKIRQDVNPYDPAWRDYLERRHARARRSEVRQVKEKGHILATTIRPNVLQQASLFASEPRPSRGVREA